jgi:hypothetical protein
VIKTDSRARLLREGGRGRSAVRDVLKMGFSLVAVAIAIAFAFVFALLYYARDIILIWFCV